MHKLLIAICLTLTSDIFAEKQSISSTAMVVYQKRYLDQIKELQKIKIILDNCRLLNPKLYNKIQTAWYFQKEKEAQRIAAKNKKNTIIQSIAQKHPHLAQFIKDSSCDEIESFYSKKPMSTSSLSLNTIDQHHYHGTCISLYVKKEAPLERVLNALKIQKIIQNKNITSFDVAKKVLSFNDKHEIIALSLGVDDKKTNNFFELINSFTLQEIKDFELLIQETGFIDFSAVKLNLIRNKYTGKLTLIDTEDLSFVTEKSLQNKKFNRAIQFMALTLTDTYDFDQDVHGSSEFLMKPEVAAYIQEQKKKEASLPTIQSIRSATTPQLEHEAIVKQEYEKYIAELIVK
jgi:hypothetical protein